MSKSIEELRAERAARQKKDATTPQNGASHAPTPASVREEPEPLPEEREEPAKRPERSTKNKIVPRSLVMSTSQDIHRSPPHSAEAEQGVLGSMLISPRTAIPEARRIITEDFFYVPAHQTIFTDILAMFDAGGAIDLLTFTQYVRDAGQIDSVGGAAFITSLYIFVPTAANIAYYLEIVRDKYILRQLIADATETVRRAYNEQDEVNALLDDREASFRTVRSAAASQLSDVESFGFGALMDFDSKADQNNLLGFRYLCRGFTCLWAAAAGAGKSSLAMQLAILWGNGLPAFSIKPVRPLKSLIIQAENDLGDTGEQLQGVMKGMARLDPVINNPSHRELTERNVVIKRVIASTGMKFCALLESLIQSELPDFVWIDPLFAFAGCDLKDAKEAGEFLREGIIPIAVRHGVCLHVIHHVGKPDKDSKSKAGWTDLDFQYLGFGSSEIQNAFRAVNIMLPVAGHEKKFRMILAKRGSRAGAKDPDGEFTTSVYLAHSAAEDGICWVQIDKPEDQDKDSKSGQFSKSFSIDDVLEHMSAIDGMKTGALQRHISTETGMSKATFYRCFEFLKKNSKIRLGEDGWIRSNQS